MNWDTALGIRIPNDWSYSFVRVDGKQLAIKSRIKRICALAGPRFFRGADGGRPSSKSLTLLYFWWAHKGSNLEALACEASVGR